ncbi:protein involved in de novo 2 [Quercus suber]|uniref:Protein involved in de novo 2 n=1 Tax=Quercus suber TaxID=58331 RepID=A0AAW0M5X0_QUESU
MVNFIQSNRYCHGEETQLGLWGSRVDAIDHCTNEIAKLSEEMFNNVTFIQEDAERERNAIRNSSLQLASLEQEKADVNRQKKELHKRIIQLQKQLDAKQALELEIERLRGSLNVMKHMGDDGDVEILEKVDTILKQLRDKEGELEDLEALNQTLIVKERKSNDELQEARKELVNRASCNKNCNMFSVHHSEVRKLPCFDVKVPEACMEKWKEHYEQYRQDMTAPLRNGREGKMRLLMKS